MSGNSELNVEQLRLNRRRALQAAAATGVAGATVWASPSMNGILGTAAAGQVTSGCTTTTAVINYVPNNGNHTPIAGSPPNIATATNQVSITVAGETAVINTSHSGNNGTATFTVASGGTGCTFSYEYWEDASDFNNGDPADLTASGTNASIMPVPNGSSRLRITLQCGPDCP